MKKETGNPDTPTCDKREDRFVAFVSYLWIMDKVGDMGVDGEYKARLRV